MRGEKDHSKLKLKDTLQVSQKKPNAETISLKDPVNITPVPASPEGQYLCTS